MKVECHHGFFKFKETRPSDIARFMDFFGLDLTAEDDYFTFTPLINAPKYSIAGSLYLGAPAIKTFEGTPSEIMRQNNLIFDFNKGLVMPVSTVIKQFKVLNVGSVYHSTGLPMPGSITNDGKRVTDYSAWHINNSYDYIITGVKCV